MWRILGIVVVALIGAGLGALAMVPVTYTEVDGIKRCQVCGSYDTVLVGLTFRNYDAARGSAVAALVVGAVFALATWGLLSLIDKRRTRRTVSNVGLVR